MTFKDETAPYIYTKTMGFSQLDRPSFEVFKLVKENISAEPPEQVSYDSGSEFSDAITGLPVNQILPVIDELLDAVHMISPKLYNATIVRLRTL